LKKRASKKKNEVLPEEKNKNDLGDATTTEGEEGTLKYIELGGRNRQGGAG